MDATFASYTVRQSQSDLISHDQHVCTIAHAHTHTIYGAFDYGLLALYWRAHFFPPTRFIASDKCVPLHWLYRKKLSDRDGGRFVYIEIKCHGTIYQMKIQKPTTAYSQAARYTLNYIDSYEPCQDFDRKTGAGNIIKHFSITGHTNYRVCMVRVYFTLGTRNSVCGRFQRLWPQIDILCAYDQHGDGEHTKLNALEIEPCTSKHTQHTHKRIQRPIRNACTARRQTWQLISFLLTLANFFDALK